MPPGRGPNHFVPHVGGVSHMGVPDYLFWLYPSAWLGVYDVLVLVALSAPRGKEGGDMFELIFPFCFLEFVFDLGME